MSKSRSQGYTLAVDNQDVVVRFDKSMIDWEMLARFLDYLELEAIRRRSKLTSAKAAELASAVDHVVWENLKSKYLEMGTKSFETV